MTHIRLATTEEIMQALDYLKRERFPVLSYPEILKAVISEAVTTIKKQRVIRKSRRSVPPTAKELMAASAKAFGVDDTNEIVYTEADGEAFTIS